MDLLLHSFLLYWVRLNTRTESKATSGQVTKAYFTVLNMCHFLLKNQKLANSKLWANTVIWYTVYHLTNHVVRFQLRISTFSQIAVYFSGKYAWTFTDSSCSTTYIISGVVISHLLMFSDSLMYLKKTLWSHLSNSLLLSACENKVVDFCFCDLIGHVKKSAVIKIHI